MRFAPLLSFLLSIGALLVGCGDERSSSRNIVVEGNLDERAALVEVGVIPIAPTRVTGAPPSISFGDLGAVANFSTSFAVTDEQEAEHRVVLFFFHVAAREYIVRVYAAASDLQGGSIAEANLPIQLLGRTGNGDITLGADANGQPSETPDFLVIPVWANGESSEILLRLRLTILPEPSQINTISVT